MILRRPSAGEISSDNGRKTPLAGESLESVPWYKRIPLRLHLALLTALMVAIAVGMVVLVTYLAVSSALTANLDQQLERQASVLLERADESLTPSELEDEIATFKSYNPLTRVSISPPGWAFSSGDPIPIGGDFIDAGDRSAQTIRTVGQERVIAVRDDLGFTVVVGQDMFELRQLTSSLGSMLMAFMALGIAVSAVAGVVVATAGLNPLWRLQRAVDYVTRTDDLRPIPVIGNDELAQLTNSFNAMLATLGESRQRQAQLVGDAGHELKTPLTSMRTNIELLMMVYRPGAPNTISEQDRKELEHDVLAQMEELSRLIGDLVDLAREDVPETVSEEVSLDAIVGSALVRVRRRRPSVEFDVQTIPWLIKGDEFALGRAAVNLLDNAAKWSPEGGCVRIRMLQLSDSWVELSIADSGPGIPVEDREQVFERFHRAAEARSMPGSGLGLAIVKQVVLRHSGSIKVGESADGGAEMIVQLPGYPDEP
ncbi:sensor histidine kinase [Corynebacterium alimapuense]|uniref:histidine kinase n=1 Tax=Corynebacterium alimapuense TaxID=1576874 RepID=A0A3M8K603_9CORY|nr:HAMP domain-containing sensor histidine kinase [Corynebacterium alimapuense]RNE48606.1 two-component sensor histidine kinase [Corynebacterium alimapuense]